jgi:VIT1/CCC1 family predicted Fe2+/Mn2+ transporter
LCWQGRLIEIPAQAVRDWELMADYRAKAFGDLSWDPFRISKGKLISEQMSANLPESQGKYTNATLEGELGTFSQRTRLVKDRSLRAFLRRFVAALFGGITLVGPMLLMVLHKDKATDLSTTSVAVFLFAIVVAYFSDAAPEMIVSVVAAYAAVLVVFVGTLQ